MNTSSGLALLWLFLPALFFLGLMLASTVEGPYGLRIVTQAERTYEQFRRYAAPMCEIDVLQGKRKRLSRGASPERQVKISALAKYRLADG